jgi:hypothetical protein
MIPAPVSRRRDIYRLATTRLEAEAEEWWASGGGSDMAMEEGTTVVGESTDFLQGTVGADYEGSLAQHWNETMAYHGRLDMFR